MPQSIEMTRQQLYDLVWSRSMGEVAASIPMAHVSLKKLCSKYQVPVPPQGHWKKSPARQAADKVPLPLTMGEQRIWVRRFVQWRPPDPRLRERTTANLSLEEPSPPNENTAHWHACTKRTKSALAQATPDRHGALKAEGVGVASVRVAPETVPRALAVLDELIRAVENLGHSIAMQSLPAAMLLIKGALVPVTIFEKFVRNHEAADAAEMKRRHLYERKYPKFFRMMDLEGGWTHRPSGKLTIMLSNGYEHGLPNRWADGASHPVEGRVDEVAAAAVSHAQAITVRHQRIEARTAERRETEQQLQQRDTETDLQSRRIAFIKRYAAMLEEAERFDRVLRHIRETNDYPSNKMLEFLKWAEAYISDLRQRCSAPAVDDELAESELWIADPAGGHH
jgi:hypothetical protein